MSKTQSRTNAERQASYRDRLIAAGKMPVRLLVKKETAVKLHAMAHANIEAPGDTLARALDALDAISALPAAAADETREHLETGAAEGST